MCRILPSEALSTLRSLSVALLGAFTVLAAPVRAADFEALAQTVVRTPPAERVALPAISRDRNVMLGRVQPFPDRTIPPVFWFDNQGVRYGVVHQRRRAPLVILIAGTGASFDSSSSRILARALYGAGMHVLGLPSPTHPNFIINGSESMVPGRPANDARDLYRVMQLALAQLEGRIDISSIYLTGYSLGALQAAWVAELDAREHALNFEKVLLLNPPVSLWNSVQILDGMYDRHVPEDPAAAQAIVDRIFERFAEVYTREQDTNLDENFLYAAYQALEPSSDALELLIGMSFRLSSSNMVFTSDARSRSGYMVAPDAQLENTTSLTNFYKHSMRTSFNDYIDGIYMPHYGGKDPTYTKQDAIEEAALVPIEGFLRQNPNMGLITNRNDIILAPGELDWLESVFGDRATIFPDGGHCGNFERRDFVEALSRFFKG